MGQRILKLSLRGLSITITQRRSNTSLISGDLSALVIGEGLEASKSYLDRRGFLCEYLADVSLLDIDQADYDVVICQVEDLEAVRDAVAQRGVMVVQRMYETRPADILMTLDRVKNTSVVAFRPIVNEEFVGV